MPHGHLSYAYKNSKGKPPDGKAFTNGIRDFMAGDLMSGTSRAGEAIFLVGGIAIGIAAFLGIVYL